MAIQVEAHQGLGIELTFAGATPLQMGSDVHLCWGLLHYLHSPDWLASFTLNLRRLLLNPECWFSLLTTEIDYMCSHHPGVVYELNNNTIYLGALLRQLNGRINMNINTIVNWLNYIDHTPPPSGTGGYLQRESHRVAWLPSS